MIGRVRGVLLSRGGPVVEVGTAGGVVYEVEVPLSVAERLPAEGAEVELYTLYRVREDQVALYGFVDVGERALFLRLVGVSGVGARLALSLLSTYSAPRLVSILAEGEVGALVQVSGVGKKSAERLVLELRDRMEGLVDAFPVLGARGDAGGGAAQEAARALVALGMSPQEADRAVREVLDEVETDRTDEIVRRALGRR